MSPADEAGAAYLRTRGIGPSEIARLFGIGRREVDMAMRKHMKRRREREWNRSR